MSTIVIVEDDSYLREELEHTFTKEGYFTVGISSFNEPEKEILENEPDLIILDINLPGKSGFELCRWLKMRTSVPILILTARDALTDELYALGLGADEFLTKPCHPKRLAARAERLLNTYKNVRNLVRAGDVIMDADKETITYKNEKNDLKHIEQSIQYTLLYH